MKKIALGAFAAFLKGFGLIMIIHLMLPIGCINPFDPVTPIEEVEVDTAGLKTTASQLESALAAGDVQAVRVLLSEDTEERIGEAISTFQSQMPVYASAFKSRKLLFSTPLYAEYGFDFDGQKVSVAFSYVDSEWKLIRL